LRAADAARGVVARAVPGGRIALRDRRGGGSRLTRDLGPQKGVIGGMVGRGRIPRVNASNLRAAPVPTGQSRTMSRICGCTPGAAG
jgi:hypothetical protein